jgi:integrase
VEAASFGALLDRYVEHELSERYSTRKSHLSNIRVHIRPRWGEYPLDKMKPMAMELWLRELPLAPKTKTHVRGIIYLAFRCAERWGLIEMGKNPVALVRVKNASKRLMRGMVGGRVDEVKTEYSRDDVPLDPRLAEVLLALRSVSMFSRDMDGVFAHPDTGEPFRQESLQKRPIKNAAKLAGLGEGIGWHTFRHNYRSWLDETGAPMKVQQELMRHASIQTTMNVYGRAMAETKRRANSQVVGLVFGPNSQESEAVDSAATAL